MQQSDPQIQRAIERLDDDFEQLFRTLEGIPQSALMEDYPDIDERCRDLLARAAELVV